MSDHVPMTDQELNDLERAMQRISDGSDWSAAGVAEDALGLLEELRLTRETLAQERHLTKVKAAVHTQLQQPDQASMLGGVLDTVQVLSEMRSGLIAQGFSPQAAESLILTLMVQGVQK